MRHASSGGDLVPPTLIEDMKQVFENAELFVIYGCTEISCMGCTYPISRGQKVTRTFVGKPFPDVVVRLIDPAGNLVPFGVVGEICFAGKGVVRGYLQRPELTVEKFVEREGRRFYQTGDMGRLHPDGNVEILGRRDYQVQLRGIRVELPGIENTVREIALAEQCAMVVKKLDEQDVRLVAFVVKPRETTIAAFRRALAAHLPDYMLPQALVAIDALPVTRNGKLDRSALQELPWENLDTEAPRTAARTTIERQIAAAFAKTLGVADVGLDDDFFDRGGHSLLAVMMLQELENSLGLSLPPGLLFEHTTVRALGEQARSSMSRVPRPIPLSENARQARAVHAARRASLPPVRQAARRSLFGVRRIRGPRACDVGISGQSADRSRAGERIRRDHPAASTEWSVSYRGHFVRRNRGVRSRAATARERRRSGIRRADRRHSAGERRALSPQTVLARCSGCRSGRSCALPQSACTGAWRRCFGLRPKSEFTRFDTPGKTRPD